MAGPSVKERSPGSPPHKTATAPVREEVRPPAPSHANTAVFSDRGRATPGGLSRALAKVSQLATALRRRRRSRGLITSPPSSTRDAVPLGSRVVVLEDRGHGNQSLLF
jgi:hypothetical protein